MAKTNIRRRSIEMPRVLDFNEIANVMTYLNSLGARDPDSIPTEEHADDLDHGRYVLYATLVEHLRYAEYTHGEELREVIAENVKLREAAKESAHG